MTSATTHHDTRIAPLEQWASVASRWVGEADGKPVLESEPDQYGTMLQSPPMALEGGRMYSFRLTGEIEPGGGVTLGLQDADLHGWIQHINRVEAGPVDIDLRVRPRRSDTFRLALANCRTSEAGRTRVRGPRVEMVAHDRDLTDDADFWKDEARRQWDVDHCGHERGEGSEKGSLEYFLSIERDRYESYSPWMREAIGFDRAKGKKVLEIGAGLGTDLAQFAKAGAEVTDLDLSQGHLEMAKRNFAARGLTGEFVLGDGEELPFPDESFDIVYSFGVIHHSPNTDRIVEHIRRVLKPRGEAIVMVYAKHSRNYWYKVMYQLWLRQGLRKSMTVADILSTNTEHSPNGARPLVKVYSAADCRKLFSRFSDVRVRKYQITPPEVNRWLQRVASVDRWGRVMGWNLLVNAVR